MALPAAPPRLWSPDGLLPPVRRRAEGRRGRVLRCHARFDERLTADEVRRQARRGALQGALLAGIGIVVTVIVIGMLIEACVC